MGAGGPDPKDRAPILKVLAHVEDLLNAKQYPAAVRAMEPGLKLDPANPLGHLYLAIAFERTGQFERAIEVYEEAIRMNVRTDQVYARLGKDELRLQHLDKAVSAMARAAELNPTDLDIPAPSAPRPTCSDRAESGPSVPEQNRWLQSVHPGRSLVDFRCGNPPALSATPCRHHP